jgi:hypothetical protein
MKFTSMGDTMHSLIQRERVKRYHNLLGISARAGSLLALWFVMVTWLMGDILWPQLAGVH